MIDVIFTMIAILALILGLYIYNNPGKTIKMQQRFYYLINWNMESVSMKLEIRNTKWMGVFLILSVITATVYKIYK